MPFHKTNRWKKGNKIIKEAKCQVNQCINDLSAKFAKSIFVVSNVRSHGCQKSKFLAAEIIADSAYLGGGARRGGFGVRPRAGSLEVGDGGRPWPPRLLGGYRADTSASAMSACSSIRGGYVVHPSVNWSKIDVSGAFTTLPSIPISINQNARSPCHRS